MLEGSEARSSSCECESHRQNHPVVAVTMVDISGGDIRGVCRLYKPSDFVRVKPHGEKSFQGASDLVGCSRKANPVVTGYWCRADLKYSEDE